MKRTLAFFILILIAVPAFAQDRTVVRDTLPAAVKVADRAQRVRADGYKIDPVKTRRVVSPLGDGDAVKYILTLPGVTMGGEGGSAIYVRGGNMGSNLMTLDGVPLYGISHLLGLTTVYPGDVIGATEFHAGGFSSEEGNFTASHIRLQTKTGDFAKTGGEGSLTPFLASASVSAPIVKDKVSFLGSFRVSPLGLEYKAARNTINKYQDVLQDFNTTVGPNPAGTLRSESEMERKPEVPASTKKVNLFLPHQVSLNHHQGKLQLILRLNLQVSRRCN